jgi:hypothetical protein
MGASRSWGGRFNTGKEGKEGKKGKEGKEGKIGTKIYNNTIL